MRGVGSDCSNMESVNPFFRVLVLGNGLCGELAARALCAVGLSCTYAQVSELPTTIYSRLSHETFAERIPVSCSDGTPWTTAAFDKMPSVKREGPFFKIDGGAEDLFGAVVFAFGASLGLHSDAIPMKVAAFQQTTPPAIPQRMGFVLDAGRDSDRYAAISAVEAALENQRKGGASYVFFRNAPVAVTGGELLYDQAKKAGVCFVRYEEGREPIIHQIAGQGNGLAFRIQAVDSVIGEPIDIQCDAIYGVGFAAPGAIQDAIYGIANYDVDQNGFLLSESIHCGLGQSFGRGVFAVGGCTGTLGLQQIASQALSVAVKARAWALRASSLASVDRISVNDECVRCLTCLRICPHSAISVNYAPARSKITSLTASCEQCGLCVSECPQEALDLIGFPQKGIESFLADIRQNAAEGSFVVYGCERSTSDLVAKIGAPPGALFLAVPCAGRVSESLLWATLNAGASGVLVIGCHPGNCASRYGTQWAGARVKEIWRKLQGMGIAAPVISYATTSARQPARFETLLHEFKRSLDKHAAATASRNENRQ